MNLYKLGKYDILVINRGSRHYEVHVCLFESNMSSECLESVVHIIADSSEEAAKIAIA